MVVFDWESMYKKKMYKCGKENKMKKDREEETEM